MLSPFNGRRLNISHVARGIGQSFYVTEKRIDSLQRRGLICLLPPYTGYGRPMLFLNDGYGAADASISCTLAWGLSRHGCGRLTRDSDSRGG